MSESKTIARPYANACFEIAQESGNAEEWLLFLENAAEVVKDSAMLNLVKSPGIDKQALAKTIRKISTLLFLLLAAALLRYFTRRTAGVRPQA
jgi:F0F1-type ATP synthase delta subunit